MSTDDVCVQLPSVLSVGSVGGYWSSLCRIRALTNQGCMTNRQEAMEAHFCQKKSRLKVMHDKIKNTHQSQNSELSHSNLVLT